MDGLLPIGYIEAEAYGRDLDALTGHAAEQNARFIENLDNFILTNFVEFQLWTDGQLRATANITDAPENLETLLERFLNAGDVQIASPEVLARYLARRTRGNFRHRLRQRSPMKIATSTRCSQRSRRRSSLR